MEEREGQRLELAAEVSSLSWGRHSEKWKGSLALSFSRDDMLVAAAVYGSRSHRSGPMREEEMLRSREPVETKKNAPEGGSTAEMERGEEGMDEE